MNNKLFRKGLVFGVIFLFFSIAVQPIISIDIEQNSNSKQVEIIKPMDENYAKEFLFETIIQIANNPDVKELIAQNKGKIFTSDINFKVIYKQLLIKNLRFLYSMIFMRPSMTNEYFNKTYMCGVEIVNIIGEDKTLEIVETIKISVPEIFKDLNIIIVNDKRVSERISTLEIMNNGLKHDTPFWYYPIICATLISILLFFVKDLLLIYGIWETLFKLRIVIPIVNTILESLYEFYSLIISIIYEIGFLIFGCWEYIP